MIYEYPLMVGIPMGIYLAGVFVLFVIGGVVSLNTPYCGEHSRDPFMEYAMPGMIWPLLAVAWLFYMLCCCVQWLTHKRQLARIRRFCRNIPV